MIISILQPTSQTGLIEPQFSQALARFSQDSSLMPQLPPIAILQCLAWLIDIAVDSQGTCFRIFETARTWCARGFTSRLLEERNLIVAGRLDLFLLN